MPRIGYKAPLKFPPTPEGLKETQRQLVEAAHLLFDGRINSVGDITLSAGTTTPLSNPKLHSQSVIIFAPTNAAAYALGLPYASSRGDKTATLTHASAAGTETYAWAALG